MPEGWNHRAITPIDIDGVRAFNPGHLVPDEIVERYEFDGDVVQDADAPWPPTDDEQETPVGKPDAVGQLTSNPQSVEDAEGNPLPDPAA